jgi:Na+/H+-dicarboxylate symporter
MNTATFDGLSATALAVTIALFVIIFLLRRKGADFSVCVLGALIAGAVVGFVFQGHTTWITPLGKIYTSVLNAIVVPLIIISILSAVTSLSGVTALKGIGLRSVGWLMATTVISILLAVGIGLTFGVGRGAHLNIEGVSAATFEGTTVPFSQVLVGFFPRNVISDISEEKIIPIILFSVLIAVSYVLVAAKDKEKVRAFKDVVEATKEIIFKAVGFIIELTPYAVLALVTTITSNGLAKSGILWSLVALLIVSFLTLIIDTYAVNAVLLKAFARVNPWQFFRKLFPAQLVAFSTQSSSATLPVTTGALTDQVGASPQVANFTASLGTTIGMPGCAGIWPVLVALYGVHGLGLHYGLRDYILLGIVSLLLSLGTAGVPGTANIVTASVLTGLGLPLEILVLVIPISSIVDTARTATNVTAAAVASTIVARQEGLLDDTVFERTLPHQRQPLTPGKELAYATDSKE